MAKVYSGLRLTLFCRLPLLSLFVSFCLWGASLTAIIPIKAFESSWLSLDISSTGRFRQRKKGGDGFLEGSDFLRLKITPQMPRKVCVGALHWRATHLESIGQRVNFLELIFLLGPPNVSLGYTLG